MASTAETTLDITGKGMQRKVVLDPKGAIIGRERGCPVELPDSSVSGRHARLHRDPFGRWIVEDLGSLNGVWVEGERVRQRALALGQGLRIGPYTLTLCGGPRKQIAADHLVTVAADYTEEGPGTTILQSKETPGESLSNDGVRQLNEIGERLSVLIRPSELYPELCRSVGRDRGAIAMVLRVPCPPAPLPGSPQVLACHVGGQQDQPPEGSRVHLSRRVLEGARSGDRPVMAASAPSPGAEMVLTYVSDADPHVVLCAAIAKAETTVDLLYLDLPSRRTGPDTLDFIQALARQAGFTAKSLLLAEVRADRTLLDQQLALAKQIQDELTPKGLHDLPGVDAAFYYQPAMWVGGDYCDIWSVQDGRLAFAIGDVSGKGLPAAMVMANLHAAMRTTMSFDPDPAQVMSRLSGHLSRYVPQGMFVTLVLGLFDPKSGQLRYVNAGHVLPLIVTESRQVLTLGRPNNPPLGVMECQFIAESRILAPDSGLVVVTDGITECMSATGEMFGPERLSLSVGSAGRLSSDALVGHVVKAAEDFRQPLPQHDDITVFAMIHKQRTSE